jgi:hypothetical protein
MLECVKYFIKNKSNKYMEEYMSSFIHDSVTSIKPKFYKKTKFVDENTIFRNGNFFRGIVTNPELVDQVIMKLHAGTPHIQRRFRSSSLSRLVGGFVVYVTTLFQ